MKIGKEDERLELRCVKSVRIRSYSVPHFPAFGLNTERYSVSLRIQPECEEIRNRITPNMDTFYRVSNSNFHQLMLLTANDNPGIFKWLEKKYLKYIL